jgi:VanZ family protein
MTGDMVYQPTTHKRDGFGRFCLHYGAGAILVVGYVNTFAIWGLLVTALGPDLSAAIPFMALAAPALAGMAVLYRTRAARPRLQMRWLLAGFVLAGLALAVTDPAFPAKRIHVPQYALLALVLRRGLAGSMSGWRLTGFGALLTLVFGIHDELIQGLHPDRTYGLTDILVNGLSGAAGSLMAHGIGLFSCPGGIPEAPTSRSGISSSGESGISSSGESGISPNGESGISPGAWLTAAGTGFLILALTAWRDAPPPIWLIFPLLAGTAVWLGGRRPDDPIVRTGLNAFVWTCFPMVLYPVLPHVSTLVFR